MDRAIEQETNTILTLDEYAVLSTTVPNDWHRMTQSSNEILSDPFFESVMGSGYSLEPMNFYIHTTKESLTWVAILIELSTLDAEDIGPEWLAHGKTTEKLLVDLLSNQMEMDRSELDQSPVYGRQLITQVSHLYCEKFNEDVQQLGVDAEKLVKSIINRYYNLIRTVSTLEKNKLLVDPIINEFYEASIIVLSLVPKVFSKRSKNGDEVILRLEAVLWKYEMMKSGTDSVYKFHFKFRRYWNMLLSAIRQLNKEMHEEDDDENDEDDLINKKLD